MKTLACERHRTEIVRRLRRLRPDLRPRWGRMSAHQMVCHLADCCRMATGEKAVSPATGAFQRTIVKWLALYAPMRWPAGIETRPEVDQEAGGTCPTDFAADIRTVEALLEHLTTQRGSFEWPPHPIFGRMSEAAWLRWAYLHMDHHLRQFGA
jgi:Protein of unknown function (DUF1569)